MSERWIVRRDRHIWEPHQWVAYSPISLAGNQIFPTWREAYDYALSQAQTTTNGDKK